MYIIYVLILCRGPAAHNRRLLGFVIPPLYLVLLVCFWSNGTLQPPCFSFVFNLAFICWHKTWFCLGLHVGQSSTRFETWTLLANS